MNAKYLFEHTFILAVVLDAGTYQEAYLTVDRQSTDYNLRAQFRYPFDILLDDILVEIKSEKSIKILNLMDAFAQVSCRFCVSCVDSNKASCSGTHLSRVDSSIPVPKGLYFKPPFSKSSIPLH